MLDWALLDYLCKSKLLSNFEFIASLIKENKLADFI